MSALAIQLRRSTVLADVRRRPTTTVRTAGTTVRVGGATEPGDYWPGAAIGAIAGSTIGYFTSGSHFISGGLIGGVVGALVAFAFPQFVPHYGYTENLKDPYWRWGNG